MLASLLLACGAAPPDDLALPPAPPLAPAARLGGVEVGAPFQPPAPACPPSDDPFATCEAEVEAFGIPGTLRARGEARSFLAEVEVAGVPGLLMVTLQDERAAALSFVAEDAALATPLAEGLLAEGWTRGEAREAPGGATLQPFVQGRRVLVLATRPDVGLSLQPSLLPPEAL